MWWLIGLAVYILIGSLLCGYYWQLADTKKVKLDPGWAWVVLGLWPVLVFWCLGAAFGERNE